LPALYHRGAKPIGPLTRVLPEAAGRAAWLTVVSIGLIAHIASTPKARPEPSLGEAIAFAVVVLTGLLIVREMRIAMVTVRVPCKAPSDVDWEPAAKSFLQAFGGIALPMAVVVMFGFNTDGLDVLTIPVATFCVIAALASFGQCALVVRAERIRRAPLLYQRLVWGDSAFSARRKIYAGLAGRPASAK
jgi:hypothetical protein